MRPYWGGGGGGGGAAPSRPIPIIMLSILK